MAIIALASACVPVSRDAASEPGADPASPTFVSLNPCLDAILVEVAEADQILAISHYSHQPGGSRLAPETASRFASTGGTAEEIIALAPDIVLASVFMPPATKAALERAGLRIESFDSPRTLEQSAAQIERITGLVDTDQRAKDVSAAMLRPPTPVASSNLRMVAPLYPCS